MAETVRFKCAFRLARIVTIVALFVPTLSNAQENDDLDEHVEGQARPRTVGLRSTPAEVSDVKAITAPTFLCEGTGGESFYRIEEDDLAVTSVYPKDGKVWTRGYKIPSTRGSRYREWEIFNTVVGTD